MAEIPLVPLTRAAFAPYGEVIQTAGVEPLRINQGFALRFDDLANIDVGEGGGTSNISVFVGTPRPAPIAIKLMERHPLGSQLFYPLQNRPWLVLVCGDPADEASYAAFSATGEQGVNYFRNVWHHPLLVCDPDSRFLVVDRKGPGNNLEEFWIEESKRLHVAV